VLLIVTLAYGYYAQQIPLDFWSQEEAINARSLPYLLAIVGAILSGILVIFSLVSPRHLKSKAENLTTVPTNDWRSLFLILVLMVLFAISIEILGFILSSICLLISGFLVLGSRSPRLIFLIAIPLVLVIWFLLDVMGIYLAEGSLFIDLAAELSIPDSGFTSSFTPGLSPALMGREWQESS
jgi:putative tricarboxylic transport membrane protein